MKLKAYKLLTLLLIINIIAIIYFLTSGKTNKGILSFLILLGILARQITLKRIAVKADIKLINPYELNR